MKLIFELGTEDRGLSLMPACDVPEYTLPEERTAPPVSYTHLTLPTNSLV